MELTSKQRAQLRGMAATMDTILHVGKDGIGDNLVKQANELAADDLHHLAAGGPGQLLRTLPGGEQRVFQHPALDELPGL